MKKIFIAVLLISTMFLLGCESETVNTNRYGYSGNYESESTYQALIEIENCVVPDELVVILEELYDEPITYAFIDYEEDKDFVFEVLSIYSPEKNKGIIMSDVYAFFAGETEIPDFIMDKEGTYIVGNYEVMPFLDDHIHKVDAWSISDLYLCLHGYADCGGDTNLKMTYKNMVKSLKYYTSFERKLTQ